MPSLRPEYLDDGTFGAWVLKCSPAVFDARGAISAGRMDGIWTINGRMTSRCDLMKPGERAFFWMSTGCAEYLRGFWGDGQLKGLVKEIVPSDLSRKGWAKGARERQTHAVPVEITFFADGVLAAQLKADPVLRDIEVLAAPQVTPSWLTTTQVAALDRLCAAVRTTGVAGG